MFAIFLGLLGLLIFVEQVFAGEPPVQVNPSNGSITNSPTLIWQAPVYPLYSDGNPYRVQVDDDSNFASINRDRYKTSTSYSPEDLNEGTWYWRIKAKDASGTWSDWSAVWSFTLTTSTPTPIPTQTPISTPSPTPSSSTQSTSSFLVSNIPSQINSDESFNISITLSLPENPNTNFYFKGAFKKPDGSNYFGLTKVSGSWIKNGSSYSSQYQITTDSSGNWSGNLEVQPDSGDSGFTGTDNYIFKVGRYTSAGSGPTWSNELTVNIIANSQSASPTTTKSPSPSPLTSLTPASSNKTAASLPKSSSKPAFKIASIAGVATATESSPESAPVVRGQKQINPVIWVGLVFILIGAGSIGYIYFKKNGKIPISLRK